MRKFLGIVPLLTLLVPATSSAHEVYVLAADTVARDLHMPPLQVFDIIYRNTGHFFFWAFLTAWVILTVFSIGISKGVERRIDPLLKPLKRYAPIVGRITLGFAIMASAYSGALFGPELPLSSVLPLGSIPLAEMLLAILGFLVAIGLFTRVATVGLIIVYAMMWMHFGVYMLTYVNYFGEMLISLILGNTAFAADRYFHHLYPRHMHDALQWFEKHAFLFLRLCFGVSLIFASVYAKFIHAQLAIDTVIEYNLTTYFPFDPEFIVLGAFAIELLLGIFILAGIEVRFASLFLMFFLGLSLLYFGEAVWPHIILAGGALSIFMNGYDRYTLEWGLMRRLRGKRSPEPAL